MIIFLHGFNSAGYGQKFHKLVEIFKGEIILSPTYPAHYPSIAINSLSKTISNLKFRYPDQTIMLIGSSMGGFYGLWLAQQFNLKCTLINPALDPLASLDKHLGLQQNFYTGEKYILKKEMLLEAKNYYLNKDDISVPYLALIDKGDELIDYKTMLDRLPDLTQCMLFEGGSHRFEHFDEASETLLKFYRQ